MSLLGFQDWPFIAVYRNTVCKYIFAVKSLKKGLIAGMTLIRVYEWLIILVEKCYTGGTPTFKIYIVKEILYRTEPPLYSNRSEDTEDQIEVWIRADQYSEILCKFIYPAFKYSSLRSMLKVSSNFNSSSKPKLLHTVEVSPRYPR